MHQSDEFVMRSHFSISYRRLGKFIKNVFYKIYFSLPCIKFSVMIFSQEKSVSVTFKNKVIVIKPELIMKIDLESYSLKDLKKIRSDVEKAISSFEQRKLAEGVLS